MDHIGTTYRGKEENTKPKGKEKVEHGCEKACGQSNNAKYASFSIHFCEMHFGRHHWRSNLKLHSCAFFCGKL